MYEVLKNWRTSAFGILSWLIPFAAAFPFFSPETGLIIPLLLFKSLMIIIGHASGIALMLWLFRHIRPTLMSGFVIGIYWLAINWLLDIVVLVPMSGSTISTWFAEIGLGYLAIPMISMALGYIAERQK